MTYLTYVSHSNVCTGGDICARVLAAAMRLGPGYEKKMTLRIDGHVFDTMAEAAKRLRISRATLRRYIDDGFLSEPRRHLLGTKQEVRVFDAAWYGVNEPRMEAARAAAGANRPPPGSSPR
jgi:hypothetical protein